MAVALTAIVRVVPFCTAQAIGRRMGDLTRLVLRKRWRVALKNLRIAYGDTIPEPERRRIARESFRHFGTFGIEMIRLAYMSDEELCRRTDVTGKEEFDQGFARGSGCLLITAHLGSFEVAGRWLAAQGFDVVALARKARDEATTNLMTRLRERDRFKVLTIDKSMRPVVQRLRRGGCVAIVCDQNASDVFVPFFGHATGTVNGPALLALRTGAAIVCGFTYREPGGRYRVVGTPPIVPEPSGDERADVVRIMTEVNRRIEDAIRVHPEQWLWFHDRWRLSPVGQQAEASDAT
jgi:KDO2-lipid IV(A) lauroyltransferase